MIPTVNSFYSGGGLIDWGLKEGGLPVQQSFEINGKCCEVARANFDHEIVQCDISLKLVKDEMPADAAVITFPCTEYTEMADIHGTRNGGVAFLHAFRHVALKKYQVYWCENVPGMRKFQVVMEALTQLPDYYVTIFCPIKTEMWLPQRRDRLFIVGSRRRFDWRAPRTTRQVPLSEILERRPQIEIPDYVYNRLNGEYRDLPIISDPKRGDIAPTCLAHYGKDLGTRMVVDKRFRRGVRPYTVREYARLQGLPDEFVFPCSDRMAYHIIGNGVSVPAGRWIARETRRYFRHYFNS